MPEQQRPLPISINYNVEPAQPKIGLMLYPLQDRDFPTALVVASSETSGSPDLKATERIHFQAIILTDDPIPTIPSGMQTNGISIDSSPGNLLYPSTQTVPQGDIDADTGAHITHWSANEFRAVYAKLLAEYTDQSNDSIATIFQVSPDYICSNPYQGTRLTNALRNNPIDWVTNGEGVVHQLQISLRGLATPAMLNLGKGFPGSYPYIADLMAAAIPKVRQIWGELAQSRGQEQSIAVADFSVDHLAEFQARALVKEPTGKVVLITKRMLLAHTQAGSQSDSDGIQGKWFLMEIGFPQVETDTEGETPIDWAQETVVEKADQIIKFLSPEP